MDGKKKPGSNKDKKSGSSANFDPSPKVSDTIDATPYGQPPIDIAGQGPAGRRSIQDTKAWKDSTSGIQSMWTNYLKTLGEYFQRMPRITQEELITRVCMIVTLGVSIILTVYFYPFVPQYLRVLAVPLILAGAWWAGTRIVAPVMIVRYEQYLNREY